MFGMASHFVSPTVTFVVVGLGDSIPGFDGGGLGSDARGGITCCASWFRRISQICKVRLDITMTARSSRLGSRRGSRAL